MIAGAGWFHGKWLIAIENTRGVSSLREVRGVDLDS
jgi:hypothetical protein